MSATWNEQTRNTGAFSNQSKNTSTWDYLGTDILLKEDGFSLLQEFSGGVGKNFEILLEQRVSISDDVWVNLSKS